MLIWTLSPRMTFLRFPWHWKCGVWCSGLWRCVVFIGDYHYVRGMYHLHPQDLRHLPWRLQFIRSFHNESTTDQSLKDHLLVIHWVHYLRPAVTSFQSLRDSFSACSAMGRTFFFTTLILFTSTNISVLCTYKYFLWQIDYSFTHMSISHSAKILATENFL